MGGLREDVIETKSTTGTETETGDDTTDQKIRIHESGGEVHFHHDLTKMKVAVPVAEWHKAWATLKQGGTFRFCDFKSMCYVKVRTAIRDDKYSRRELYSTVTVRPFVISDPVYEKLKKFSEAK